MLNKEMTLKNMIDMVPGGDDMAMLDLDVVVYIKATIVSIDKRINHAFIRHMLIERYQDEVLDTFKAFDKTVFYDFMYADERAITIFELYSKKTYAETESFLSEILESYSHDAEVLFDIYTHDMHAYRLSDLDAIVKNDRLY